MCPEEEKQNETICTCPFCAAWEAYKKSDVACHVGGMKREGLLALRSALDWCIARSKKLRPKE